MKSRWQTVLAFIGIIVAIVMAGGSAVYAARSGAQQQVRQHRVTELYDARASISDFSNALDTFLDDREAKGFVSTIPRTWAGFASFERSAMPSASCMSRWLP